MTGNIAPFTTIEYDDIALEALETMLTEQFRGKRHGRDLVSFFEGQYNAQTTSGMKLGAISNYLRAVGFFVSTHILALW